MLAAKTTLPVLGVPVPSRHLQGLDSLLSIVQMPAGVPVATFAIGVAGAHNAGAVRGGAAGGRRPGAGPAAGRLPRRPDRPRARAQAAGVRVILPGATVGMLGGGQLGRMFTLRARDMGYRVVVLDPDPASPAGQVADRHLCRDYADGRALEELAATCDAVTTEFENVPAETLERLARTGVGAAVGRGGGDRAGPDRREDLPPGLGIRDRGVSRGARPATSSPRPRASSAPPRCSRPAAWATTARARRR